jgi:SlyX protein
MDSSITDIEQRLVDLEIKASFAEDLLDDLNRLVATQQAQIDALVQRLQQVQQQAAAGETGSFRSLRDELPPHY